MKIIKLRLLRVFAVAVAMGAAIIGCGTENPITTTGSGPVVSARNTPTVMPQEIRRSDGGRTFLLADGWPIPSFGEAVREECEISITTADGRSVKVHCTIIRTDPLSLITDNPLYSIGTAAGVFCYKFTVNDAEVDEGTNKVRSTRGYLYQYKYYDEDGDGVFESLVINEKDRNGRKFGSEPHLPKWSVDNR